MDRSSRSFDSTHLILPLVAIAGAIFSVVLLLSSGVGTRAGLWHFRTGFSLLKFAAYTGLGCALLAVISGIIAVRRRLIGPSLIALAALICAIVAFGVPFSWKAKAERYPRIHDISTDLNNPPQFAPAPIVHPGAAVAAEQLRAYPDLKTVVLPIPKDQAFETALATAREMGWTIVSAAPEEGRIQATDTTFWFGFTDDISIRLFPAGERTLLDVRSVSRVGISDVGTNAERIRAFLAKMSHRKL